jgi:hypothetical protein
LPCFNKLNDEEGGADTIDGDFDEVQLLVYVDDLAYHGPSPMAVQTFVDEFELEFGDIGDCIPDQYLDANRSQ